MRESIDVRNVKGRRFKYEADRGIETSKGELSGRYDLIGSYNAHV